VSDDPLAMWRWLVRVRRHVFKVSNGDFYGLMEWLRCTDADVPKLLRLSVDRIYDYLLWTELREFFEGQLNYREFVRFLQLCDEPLAEFLGLSDPPASLPRAAMAFDVMPKRSFKEMVEDFLPAFDDHLNAAEAHRVNELIEEICATVRHPHTQPRQTPTIRALDELYPVPKPLPQGVDKQTFERVNTWLEKAGEKKVSVDTLRRALRALTRKRKSKLRS
jgi:hypothetical protein